MEICREGHTLQRIIWNSNNNRLSENEPSNERQQISFPPNKATLDPFNNKPKILAHAWVFYRESQIFP